VALKSPALPSQYKHSQSMQKQTVTMLIHTYIYRSITTAHLYHN